MVNILETNGGEACAFAKKMTWWCAWNQQESSSKEGAIF